LLCILCVSAAAADEVQTLLSIKAAFRDSTTRVFDSWVSQNPVCSFSGITCDSNGFVKEIELSNQNLTGVVPVSDFCRIQFLEKLSLGFNNLYGTVAGLNGCSNLKYLDLGNNLFSGSFPNVSSLTGLVTLHANLSGFSGIFPWDSLKNMSNLQVLSVGDNPFDTMPFPAVITNLTTINWLYMSNCSIEGNIPEEIGNLNNLSGEIPAGITKLNKLRMLELYSNSFTGEFPAGFRNLTNLEFFDASMNSLRGNLSEIGFLNKLQSLQLFENQFSGEVPAELGDFKNLVNLSLYTNQLTGPLPEKLGSWADFNFIDVSTNNLTGPIPPEMCKMGTMKKLLMLQNNFTGEIPATYAGCKTLVRFRVSQNSLSGQVPGGIWGLPNAEIIDLAGNEFEGPISSSIASAASLAQLFLSSNRFSGELPPEISQSTSLVSMELGYNNFSGQIPATIGQLTQLTCLQLQGNNFSGPIPDSIGSCSSINEINMAGNELSGQIPSTLGSLPALNFLNLSKNHLSGQIPASLSSLRLNILDLSDNGLTGLIPDSLLTEAKNGSFSGNPALCSDRITGFRRCSPGSGGNSGHVRIVMFCLTAVFVSLLALLLILFYMKKAKRGSESGRSLKADSWNLKSFHVITFTEDEILDSIKPENQIGRGGSGDVYRVVLPDGKELAVKHLAHHSDHSSGRHQRITSSTPIFSRVPPGRSRELDAEVRTLSSVRHVNVVKLYCSITSVDSSLLVYEYMPNGSLWDRLHFPGKALDWETRYEIAVGAARGLEYLHHGCERPVIHRDVKSSNILLDDRMQPRIADFGLAKILRPEYSHGDSTTRIIPGTHGYIAPEYGYTSKVNEKSDIYSFGVVLMELVTGLKPIVADSGENSDLVDWVCRRLKMNGDVMGLVDSRIADVFRESAIRVMKVAMLCTARIPSSRPSMRTVVQMLKAAQPCELLSVFVGK
ncbi:hypothetical protein M569_01518, partial [Genlisea aurea]